MPPRFPHHSPPLAPSMSLGGGWRFRERVDEMLSPERRISQIEEADFFRVGDQPFRISELDEVDDADWIERMTDLLRAWIAVNSQEDTREFLLQAVDLFLRLIPKSIPMDEQDRSMTQEEQRKCAHMAINVFKDFASKVSSPFNEDEAVRMCIKLLTRAPKIGQKIKGSQGKSGMSQ